MSLQNWLSNGWLRPHQAGAEEVKSLLQVADRDLRDCQARGLSDDWRFAIAYNAALQLARAALHAAGYDTPKGESQHLRSIDSLQFTIGIDPVLLARFQAFRKKRAAGVYEAAGMITRADATNMIALATDLRRSVESWIQKTAPDLFK